MSGPSLQDGGTPPTLILTAFGRKRPFPRHRDGRLRAIEYRDGLAARCWDVIEGSAQPDQWLSLGAGLELADELVEVGGRPGVQVRQRYRLAFLRVGDQIGESGGGQAGGSVRNFWLTRVSLKFRHLAPYNSGPIQYR